MLKVLILCGGQSTRMGADKGSLKFNNSTLVELMIAKVKELFVNKEILLSVNSQQLPYYQQFVENNISLLEDISFAAGPLRGIFSAFYIHSDSDFMVFTCDMIALNKNVIEQLYQTYLLKVEFDLIHFNLVNQWLPFPCIIKKDSLKRLKDYYQNENQNNFSMRHFVNKCNPYQIELAEIFAPNFVNVNTPQDLSQLGEN